MARETAVKGIAIYNLVLSILIFLIGMIGFVIGVSGELEIFTIPVFNDFKATKSNIDLYLEDALLIDLLVIVLSTMVALLGVIWILVSLLLVVGAYKYNIAMCRAWYGINVFTFLVNIFIVIPGLVLSNGWNTSIIVYASEISLQLIFLCAVRNFIQYLRRSLCISCAHRQFDF